MAKTSSDRRRNRTSQITQRYATVALVTGGAGYIGSHACKLLAQQGYIPVTFDSLVTGWASAMKFGPCPAARLTTMPITSQVSPAGPAQRAWKG
jgi:hypothetical protein